VYTDRLMADYTLGAMLQNNSYVTTQCYFANHGAKNSTIQERANPVLPDIEACYSMPSLKSYVEEKTVLSGGNYVLGGYRRTRVRD
jgi:hypothetical protein